MKSADHDKEKVAELRKIERQAKQLIYKMRRLEAAWKKLRAEVKSTSLPKTLGDILSQWNRL